VPPSRTPRHRRRKPPPTPELNFPAPPRRPHLPAAPRTTQDGPPSRFSSAHAVCHVTHGPARPPSCFDDPGRTRRLATARKPQPRHARPKRTPRSCFECPHHLPHHAWPNSRPLSFRPPGLSLPPSCLVSGASTSLSTSPFGSRLPLPAFSSATSHAGQPACPPFLAFSLGP
jgi:hypothetical protein